ncbi:hypothetical protein ACO0QE_004130 [Hanseniaspora vineae]
MENPQSTTSECQNIKVEQNSNTFETNDKPPKRKYGTRATDCEGILPSGKISKTLRASQSCDRCRWKKIKCKPNDSVTSGLKDQVVDANGHLACSNCLASGFKCEYNDKVSRRCFSKGYTDILEAKVIELQKQVDLLMANAQQISNTEASATLLPLPLSSSSSSSSSLSATSQSEFLRFETLHDDTTAQDKPVQQVSSLFEKQMIEKSQHHFKSSVYMGTMPLNYLPEFFYKSSALPLNNTAMQYNRFQISSFLQTAFDFQFNTLTPACLTGYLNDDPYRSKIIMTLINQIVDFELKLFPVLYPRQDWLQFCKDNMSFAKKTKIDINTLHNKVDNDFYIFLGFLIVVYQWFFKRFSDDDVFQLIKMVTTNVHSPRSVQLLMFFTYYASSLSQCSTIKFEMIDLCYTKIHTMGLYLPLYAKNTTQSNDSKIQDPNLSKFNDELKLMIFYSFQFLQKWIQTCYGLPETDRSAMIFSSTKTMLANMKHLDGQLPQYLKSFILLSKFLNEEMVHCSLDHLTDNDDILAKLQIFKKDLLKYNLYHTIDEHLFTEEQLDEEMDYDVGEELLKSSDSTRQNSMTMEGRFASSQDKQDLDSKLMQLRFLSTDIDASQYMEIQITLYYLLLKLFALKNKGVENFELMNSVLSLYYIIYSNRFEYQDLLHNEKQPHLPCFFKIMQTMPIDSLSVIKYCVDSLQNSPLFFENDYFFMVWMNILNNIPENYDAYESQQKLFGIRGNSKVTPDDGTGSQEKASFPKQQLKTPLPSFHEDDDLNEDIDEAFAKLSNVQSNNQLKKDKPIFRKKRLNTLKFDSLPDTKLTHNLQTDSNLTRKKKTLGDLTANFKSPPPSTFHPVAEPKPKVWNMEDMEEDEEAGEVVLTEKQRDMLFQKRMTHTTAAAPLSIVSRGSQRDILRQEREYAKLLSQDDLEELHAIYNKGKGATATLDNPTKLHIPGTGRLSEDEDRLDQAVLSNEHFVEDHSFMMGGHSKLALSEREKQIENMQRKQYISKQLDTYGDHIVLAPRPTDMTQRGSVLQMRQELQNLQETLVSELSDINLELSKIKEELNESQCP